MRRVARRNKGEPTIALINVVFLMLIFFLVAGTVARPLDRDLSLVETTGLAGREPPDALVIHANGRLSYRGAPLESANAFLALQDGEDLTEVRLVPDRALAAERMVEVAAILRSGGAQSVIIVTEQAMR